MTMRPDPADPDAFARRIAYYERVSSALWMVLGLVQLFVAFKLPALGFAGAIAGVWNIWASFNRWGSARVIQARHLGVPDAFKPLWPLVAIGLVNLLVGGVIGVAFVGLDLWVRQQIRSHAWVFDAPAAETAA